MSLYDIHQNCVHVTHEQSSHVDRRLSEVALCCQQSGVECSVLQCGAPPRCVVQCAAVRGGDALACTVAVKHANLHAYTLSLALYLLQFQLKGLGK